MRTAVAFLALALAMPSFAQDQVTVSALRHPVDKSYRRMVKGMTLFEERHAMAPAAGSLRSSIS